MWSAPRARNSPSWTQKELSDRRNRRWRFPFYCSARSSPSRRMSTRLSELLAGLILPDVLHRQARRGGGEADQYDRIRRRAAHQGGNPAIRLPGSGLEEEREAKVITRDSPGQSRRPRPPTSGWVVVAHLSRKRSGDRPGRDPRWPASQNRPGSARRRRYRSTGGTGVRVRFATWTRGELTVALRDVFGLRLRSGRRLAVLPCLGSHELRQSDADVLLRIIEQSIDRLLPGSQPVVLDTRRGKKFTLHSRKNRRDLDDADGPESPQPSMLELTRTPWQVAARRTSRQSSFVAVSLTSISSIES
jgi:hypothetical protein